jgi:hypothetical protein
LSLWLLGIRVENLGYRRLLLAVALLFEVHACLLLLDKMLLIIVFLLLHQVLRWIFISIYHGANARALEAIGN